MTNIKASKKEDMKKENYIYIEGTGISECKA